MDIDELLSKAEAGDIESQCDLGDFYYNGNSMMGVPKNRSEAVKWWTKAAERGYPEAQGRLGMCYAEGNGVEKNEEEALKWFKKAGEQLFTHANVNLGNCCEKVEIDYDEAIKWLTKDEGQRNADATRALETFEIND